MLVNIYPLPSKMFQKSNQFEKRFGLEPAGWEVERVINRRIGPVRPFACDAETAVLALAENQRIDAGYTPLLEYFEALASKWMKRMTDFRPSQIRTVGQCSLR